MCPCSGTDAQSRTWRTYGEALYDWWQTLETNGWAWNEVGVAEIAAYRDRMLGGLAIIPEGLSHAARSMAAFERWHSFIDGA